MIIAATMTLHNYIHAHDRDDIHYERFDRDLDYVPTIQERMQFPQVHLIHQQLRQVAVIWMRLGIG
jgi:hypothetical protein